MAVAGIAYVAVVVVVGRPGAVVGTVKYVVIVNADAASMAPQLIRLAPRLEAV